MITKNKKNRNKKRKKGYSLFFPFLFSLLILLAVIFLIYTNINIGQHRAELTERINVLRKEIQILEEENQRLEEKITRVDQKDFLEERAREELGLKRPGEEVVVISPIEEAAEKSIEKEKSFWQRIWQGLGF